MKFILSAIALLSRNRTGRTAELTATAKDGIIAVPPHDANGHARHTTSRCFSLHKSPWGHNGGLGFRWIQEFQIQFGQPRIHWPGVESFDGFNQPRLQTGV